MIKKLNIETYHKQGFLSGIFQIEDQNYRKIPTNFERTNTTESGGTWAIK